MAGIGDRETLLHLIICSILVPGTWQGLHDFWLEVIGMPQLLQFHIQLQQLIGNLEMGLGDEMWCAVYLLLYPLH